MRDVRFWSDTRSAAEVLANKDATLTGAESGLFAWYTLDQGAGGGTSTSTRTIIDSAGSNDAEPLNFTMGGTVSNFVPSVDNTDLDASLTAAAGVAEPVAIPTQLIRLASHSMSLTSLSQTAAPQTHWRWACRR